MKPVETILRTFLFFLLLLGFWAFWMEARAATNELVGPPAPAAAATSTPEAPTATLAADVTATAEVTSTGQITATAVVPTEAPTATPAETPNTLPRTGGPAAPVGNLLFGLVVLLVGSLALLYRRRIAV